MKRISDELLDYYGELYTRWAIGKAGIAFENFLLFPDYYMEKLAAGYGADNPDEVTGLRAWVSRIRRVARRRGPGPAS